MAHQAVTRAQIVINLKTNLVLTRKTAISKLIEGGKRKSISLAPESKKGKQVFEALKFAQKQNLNVSHLNDLALFK